MSYQPNQQNFTKRRPASPFEYILWICAASDRSILETCSGQTRKFHSLIGVFVLLTSTFASFSAIIAVKYLTESIINEESQMGIFDYIKLKPWVIGVALIWGFLIFSIDRILISTIYKARSHFTHKTSFFYNAFLLLFRIVIATGIAFSISTLVELQIFNDKINSFSLISKDNSIKKAIADTGYDGTIDEKKNENDSIGIEAGQIDGFLFENKSASSRRVFQRYPKIKNHPEISSSFSNAAKCTREIKKETTSLQNRIDDLNRELDIHYKIENGENMNDLNKPFWVSVAPNRRTLDKNTLNQVISSKYKRVEDLEDTMAEIKAPCSALWNSAESQANSKVDELKLRRNGIIKQIDSNVSLVDSLDKEKNQVKKVQTEIADGESSGLAGKYNMLQKMIDDPDNRSTYLLHLFLIGLFLVVELLPVMGKYITPVSGYDFKISFNEWKEEQETMFLKEKFENEIRIKKSHIQRFIDDLNNWNKVN